MEIKCGGFIPTTLLDYPGEVASVIFLPGCNFKCPYCHNPSLVNKNSSETFLSIDEILLRIEKRKKVITGVVITGGEPTIYNNLDKLITRIKKMGLLVKLDTNGSNPEILKNLTPDYIAMDLKTSLEKYPVLGVKDSGLIEESINYIKRSGIDYEFRTTAAPIIFTEYDLKELIPLLEDAKRYFLTNFRKGDILDMNFNKNTPYSTDEMENFKKICTDAGIPCTIR